MTNSERDKLELDNPEMKLRRLQDENNRLRSLNVSGYNLGAILDLSRRADEAEAEARKIADSVIISNASLPPDEADHRQLEIYRVAGQIMTASMIVGLPHLLHASKEFKANALTTAMADLRAGALTQATLLWDEAQERKKT